MYPFLKKDISFGTKKYIFGVRHAATDVLAKLCKCMGNARNWT